MNKRRRYKAKARRKADRPILRCIYCNAPRVVAAQRQILPDHSIACFRCNWN